MTQQTTDLIGAILGGHYRVTQVLTSVNPAWSMFIHVHGDHRHIQGGEMEIQALRALVERALADKILTRAELDAIAEGISADGIVSEEEEEIIRTIQEKVKNQEIEIVDQGDPAG